MPKKILVVDDERPIVKLIEINLRKAGYDVVCAYDGIEALEKVRSEEPDIIVLDVMMPRMNGFDVLKRLRADPDTEHIQIIMLAAKGQDADIFAGWHGGITSYLTKPLNPRDLLDEIARQSSWSQSPRRGYISGRKEPQDGVAPRKRRMSVVVICPDNEWRKQACKALHRNGHLVDAYAHVEPALAAMWEKQPERIILLPFCDESAESVRERMKTHPPTSHIQVLMPRDETSFERLADTLGD